MNEVDWNLIEVDICKRTTDVENFREMNLFLKAVSFHLDQIHKGEHLYGGLKDSSLA